MFHAGRCMQAIKHELLVVAMEKFSIATEHFP